MIFLVLFILFSLTGNPDIEIRISNQSNVVIENVRIRFPSQVEDYGTISAKEVTAYRVIKKAYRYAYVEATVDGKPAVIQPFDYVGEKELKPGNYTYVLTVNQKATSQYDRLRLKCRKE